MVVKMENLIRVHGKVDAAVEAGYRVLVASRDGLKLRYKREDGSIAVEDYKPKEPLKIWHNDWGFYRYPE